MKQRVTPHVLRTNRHALTLAWFLFAGLLVWIVLIEPWAGFQFGLPGVLVVGGGCALLAVIIGVLLYGGTRVRHQASKEK